MSFLDDLKKVAQQAYQGVGSAAANTIVTATGGAPASGVKAPNPSVPDMLARGESVGRDLFSKEFMGVSVPVLLAVGAAIYLIRRK